MKIKFLTLVMAIAFVGIAHADCTVTTDCVTKTYQTNSVSVSYNGTNVIVKNGEGAVIDSFVCENSSVSSNCSTGDNGGGDFDICDHIPANLKPLFGCQ
ncbi:hypothetical protein [Aquimarina longa]|uniref:hypothetical protein n=1 Tax=Aquimarina longa TaxID=1080221 RepID=UPI0007855100|nr:hypothetical protein [Aquimarina longa]